MEILSMYDDSDNSFVRPKRTKRTRPPGIVNGLSVCFFLVAFNSCGAYMRLPYLKDAGKVSPELLSDIARVHEPRIMPNDVISITVNSTVRGAAADFNLPLVPNNRNNAIQTTGTSSADAAGLQNYPVDKDGKIDFPILGELKLSGMTLKEVQDSLVSLICPRYIAEKPVVTVRFVKFEVSVLGEVASPGIYGSPNGQMTILDALAAAGDMTIYGRRDNVLLVRTLDSGEIVAYRIDVQDKDMVRNGDVFYLRQNDRLYVETNKAKGNNSGFGTFESVGLSVILSTISITVSIISIITRR